MKCVAAPALRADIAARGPGGRAIESGAGFRSAGQGQPHECLLLQNPGEPVAPVVTEAPAWLACCPRWSRQQPVERARVVPSQVTHRQSDVRSSPEHIAIDFPSDRAIREGGQQRKGVGMPAHPQREDDVAVVRRLRGS